MFFFYLIRSRPLSQDTVTENTPNLIRCTSKDEAIFCKVFFFHNFLMLPVHKCLQTVVFRVIIASSIVHLWPL